MQTCKEEQSAQANPARNTVSYIDQILVLIVFAASLNLVMGYAGVFNAASAAFGAVGGYALIWLTTSHGMPYLAAAAIGIAVAAVFGLLVGYAALRLEQLWLLLLTLAVQLVFIGTVGGLHTFGSSSGLQASNLNILGHELVLPTESLPIIIVGSVVVFALCWRIGESPYGRVLRGIRDDETATRSLGKNTFPRKLVVFTITAAMAGFGGVLLSTQTTVANPSLFGFNVSIQVIAMVMIGGTANLLGTVIGVALVVLLTPFFENVIHLSTTTTFITQQLAYGLALVVIISFRPQGILPEGVTPLRLARGIARWMGGLRGGLARPEPALAGVPAALNAPAADLREEGHQKLVELTQDPPPTSRARTTPRVAPIAAATGGDGESILKVRNLTKSFGGNTAVNNMSMDLQRGTITALIGPNGAGKTTVFNLITGAFPIDAGRVYLYDRNITGLRPDVVTKMGMARSFQDVRVLPSLTVLDNVMLGVQGHAGEQLGNLFVHPMRSVKAEREARDHAYKWLDFIEMRQLAQVRAGSLGFGQQKLVALARILATEAEVLLLDEPGSGIDHGWLDEMIGVILEIRAAGRTVCIVEHNLDVVGRLADQVYFMELGRVTATGTYADLTADPRLTEAYFGSI